MRARYAGGVTLMILLAAGCGSGSDATPATTGATAPTSTAAAATTTAAAATTTTLIDFSRESRLALGRCKDSYGDPANFASLVAHESIDGPSAALAATQKACTEAEEQLKADHAPADSTVGRMLTLTVTLNEALDRAEQQIEAGTFLAPPCPKIGGCLMFEMATAVDRFDTQATARLG